MGRKFVNEIAGAAFSVFRGFAIFLGVGALAYAVSYGWHRAAATSSLVDDVQALERCIRLADEHNQQQSREAEGRE